MPEVDLTTSAAVVELAETICSRMRSVEQGLSKLTKARLKVEIENQTGEALEVDLIRDDKQKVLTIHDGNAHSVDTFERQEWRLVIRRSATPERGAVDE